MKYKVGDKVRFLHEMGGGTVSRILDETRVMVRDEDGFEIPESVDKLVKVDEVGRKPAPAPVKEEKKPKAPAAFGLQQFSVKEDKIIIGVIPQTAMSVKLVVLNHSGFNISCIIGLEKDQQAELILNCELEPGCFTETDGIGIDEMKRHQTLMVQALIFGEGVYKRRTPADFDLNMNDLLRAPVTANAYFTGPAGIIELELEEEDAETELSGVNLNALASVLKEKGDTGKTKEAKKSDVPEDLVEVDLHIESLTDDHKGMENAEMLKMQLDRFETELNRAIAEKKKKIVFIHGVGNGTLKYELRRSLDKKYSDYIYQDASFAEYGFGATMVFLK